MDVDRAAERSFKVDEEGRLVFYPFGMLAKGRVMPDRATAAALYARQKLLYQVAAGGGAGLALAYRSIGAAWTAGLCAALCLVVWLCMYPLIRRLPVSGESYDFGESVEGHSRLFRLSLVSLLLMACSALILVVSGPEDRWIGFAGVGFFGFAFLMFVARSLSKAQQRKRAADAQTIRRRAQPRESAVVSRRIPSEGFGKRKDPL